MATESGTLKFVLLGEDRSASKTLQGVAGEADKTVGKMAKLSTVVGTAIGVVAASAIANFADKSVQSFSALEDATAAAGVVFGSSMGKITAQADTAAQKLFMSKAQVIDAANMFGTYGKAAGLAGDELASFSVEMTQLAADFSSFKGGSPEEAIVAIGAAFRGETEPIRRYGIMLDDASIRQQALKMGLVSTTKEALDPQTKALAVHKLILEQSTDAQGDAARTADSAANVNKRFTATTEDLSAALGGTLSPTVVAGQTALIGLMEAAQGNVSVLPPLIALLGGTAAAVGGLFVVSKAAAGFQALQAGIVVAQGAVETFGLRVLLLGRQMESTKVAALGSSIMGVGQALPVIGTAALAAGAAWLYFAAKAEESRQRVESLTEAIREDSGALGENTRATVVASLAKQGYLDNARAVGASLSDVTDAALGNAEALQRVTDSVTAANGGLAALNTNAQLGNQEGARLLEGLRNTNGELARSVDAAKMKAEALGEEATATRAATDATVAATDATKEAAEATRKHADALWATINATLAASGSQIAFKESVAGAAETIAKNGKTLDLNTKAGRENQKALDGIVSSTAAAVKAMTENGASSDELTAKVNAGRDAFIEQATKIVGTKEKAAALWETYKLNPGIVETLIQQRGAEDAATKAAALRARIDEIPKSHRSEFLAAVDTGSLNRAEALLAYLARNRIADVSIRVTGQTGARKAEARASGGPVSKGKLYRVGEQGEELFVPNVDGTIIPAGETRRILSGGGTVGGTAGGLDMAAIARALDSRPVQVVLDGRVVAESVRRHNRAVS